MGPGVGFGCLGMVVALLIGAFLLTTAYMSGRPGWVNLLPFIVVTLVGIGLLIPKKTRRIGVGFSIVSAASWLVIIGPCFVPGALTTY